MTSKQAAKGNAFERELATYLNTHAYGATQCERAPLSGGGKVGIHAGGADLLGTPGLFVEAKRVERLNFREALRQATKNAETTGAPEAPVVITRRSREGPDDMPVLLRMKDFLTFYRAWLRENGYASPASLDTPPT